jgi:hypothetical protein
VVKEVQCLIEEVFSLYCREEINNMRAFIMGFDWGYFLDATSLLERCLLTAVPSFQSLTCFGVHSSSV